MELAGINFPYLVVPVGDRDPTSTSRTTVRWGIVLPKDPTFCVPEGSKVGDWDSTSPSINPGPRPLWFTSQPTARCTTHHDTQNRTTETS